MKTGMEKFKLTHLERLHRDRIVAHSHSNKTETSLSHFLFLFLVLFITSS